MNGPLTVDVSADKHVASISIPMQGDGTDQASANALAALRGGIVDQTVGSAPGVKSAYVTGIAAGTKDFNDLVKAHAPIVFAFVLSLAFLLLLVTFRSIVIPIKAIVLNLLSVGAAYGILTWIFQDGHFQSLLGYKSNGGIVSWLPLFLFVILFGLSMDYHVFILSRIREAFDRGMKTEDAVAYGIKATASTVTSAAIVMVAVFAIFATLSSLDFKMMGVGLSVAILLDATLVRAVLLPATMKLLGDWNWYLPKGLQLAAAHLPRACARSPLARSGSGVGRRHVEPRGPTGPRGSSIPRLGAARRVRRVRGARAPERLQRPADREPVVGHLVVVDHLGRAGVLEQDVGRPRAGGEEGRRVRGDDLVVARLDLRVGDGARGLVARVEVREERPSRRAAGRRRGRTSRPRRARRGCRCRGWRARARRGRRPWRRRPGT